MTWNSTSLYTDQFHKYITNLQPPSDLSLLAYNRRVIVQSDIMEQRLQEYIRDSNQIVILLGLVERILRFVLSGGLWKKRLGMNGGCSKYGG